MASVEVVVTITDQRPDIDIEKLQDKISDLLYKAGYRIAPVGVTLLEDDKPCACG